MYFYPYFVSISSGLEFLSGNHTSIYENSELKVFKKKIIIIIIIIIIKFLVEISKNWLNDLLGINKYKTLESYKQSLLTILPRINTTSVVSKWCTFWLFLSFSYLTFGASK